MLTGRHTSGDLLLPQDPIRLTINILSAACLPKPGGAQRGEVIDPFVNIFLHGPNDNEDVPKAKTKTVLDNGFNPVWNQVRLFKTFSDFYKLSSRRLSPSISYIPI